MKEDYNPEKKYRGKGMSDDTDRKACLLFGTDYKFSCIMQNNMKRILKRIRL